MALSAALLDAFERFWGAYPPPGENPKAPAREVFARRVREGADPEAVVRAAAAYAAACKSAGKDCQFIPHARTWLSQRRYEDYAPTPPADAAPDLLPPHPLAFMVQRAGADAFRSWLEPLRVDLDARPVRIIAPHRLSLDRVRSTYGADLTAWFGPVEWVVERSPRKETP